MAGHRPAFWHRVAAAWGRYWAAVDSAAPAGEPRRAAARSGAAAPVFFVSLDRPADW